MTRTPIYGISLIIFMVIVSSSCSTIKIVKDIQKGGHLWQEMYSYYVNDSLSLSYRLGGNIDQIKSKTKIMNTFLKANMNLPVRNCIACFKTWSNPNPKWLEITYYTLYFPNEKQTIFNKLLNTIKKDTHDFYTDTNKYIIGKFIPLEDNKGSAYIISHSGKDGFISAIRHNAISNIVTNEKYRDITFTPPFELAREEEIHADTTVDYLSPVYILKRRELNYTDIHSKFSWLQAYGTFVSRITNEENESRRLNEIKPNVGTYQIGFD